MGARRLTRRALLLAGLAAVAALVPVVVIVATPLVSAANVIVYVEDTVQPDDAAHAIRADERRADAILLVRTSRRCDTASIVSIARDLVVAPGSLPLAVLDETTGRDGLRAAVERLTRVRVDATVRLDLAGVAAIVRAIGPVEVDLDAESRDLATGFSGGPGPVRIDGDNVLSYLRSRDWEERIGDEFVLTSTDDQARIARAQDYLRAALDAVDERGRTARVGLLIDLLRHGHLHVTDPAGATALARRLGGARTITFATFPTIEARTIDERRSPFAPDELGASRLLVPAAGAVPLPPVCGART